MPVQQSHRLVNHRLLLLPYKLQRLFAEETVREGAVHESSEASVML